jgi:ABC-type nitrate/sulfonate/bicarbonate transport system substrate-binding protein
MPFHARSSLRLRNLTMIAPDQMTRLSAAQVYGFANMSGAGAAISGRGSRFIAPDARDIWAYGMPAAAVGLPANLLARRPVLDLRAPVSLT